MTDRRIEAAGAVEEVFVMRFHHNKKTLFSCSPSREKAKAKLSQKVSVEGQRSKMRLSPGLLPVPELVTPRRNTTGKKQPRRTDRSNSAEENPGPTWGSRGNQHR